MIGPLKVVCVEESVQYDCMYLIAQNIRRGNRPNGIGEKGLQRGRAACWVIPPRAQCQQHH